MNRHTLVCCLGMFACLLLTAASMRAGDWTEFRGPTGQGHSADKNLPVKWGRTENVAWNVDIPGNGWSSPVVSQGRVFLTTAIPRQPGRNDGDQLLHVVCLDAETGRSLWNTQVFEQRAAETDRIHNKNSHASPTPIVEDGRVYVHFGTNGTACLTVEGQIVWRNRELRYTPRHGNGGSPALVDDLLIVICDGANAPFVVALDKQSGKTRWKEPRPEVANPKLFSFSTPLVIEQDGKKQVVCPGTDVVIAYDPPTGREIWRVDYDGYSVVPRPVFAHGLVYVCTGWDTPRLLAIRPGGAGNVTDSHVSWQMVRGVPNTPSLLVDGEELYMVSDAGVASCVDPQSGRTYWQQRLGGTYSASPILADNKIYFQSEQGQSTVIRPGRRFELLARNDLEDRTLASPAVADSSLFIRTENELFRISSAAQ